MGKLLVIVNLVLIPTLSEGNFFSYDFFFKRKYIKDISEDILFWKIKYKALYTEKWDIKKY